MAARRQWTVALFLFVAGNGAIAQARGALLPSIEQSFSVTQSYLGLVAPASTVGLVLAVLAVGMRSGHLSVKRYLLLGTGLTAVCMALLSVAFSYGFLLSVFLVQGAVVGIVRALDRPLLGHLYPSRRGQLFNLYGLVWAVGATGGPILVNGILSVGDWRLTYGVLSLVFALVLGLIWRLDAPVAASREQALSMSDLGTVLRRPAVFGMGAALVVSGGIEGAVFTWLPYYATGFFDPATANLLLSGFLVMYVPGRLLYSVVTSRINSLDLVVPVAVLAIPLLYVAFVTESKTGLLVSVFGLGFLVSGFFPMLSAFGVDALPEYSGPVNAVATSANFAGLSLVPVLVGLLTNRYGIAVGMQLLLPLMGVLTVVLLVLRLRVQQRPIADSAV